jgi:hypothetical protein
MNKFVKILYTLLISLTLFKVNLAAEDKKPYLDETELTTSWRTPDVEGTMYVKEKDGYKVIDINLWGSSESYMYAMK